MSETPLILASGSPRRRELLSHLGVPFEVLTAGTPEHDHNSAPHLSPLDLAIENARLKARAVAQLPSAAFRWVLGADTVVSLEGRLFGKPASLAEAKAFLQSLRGHTHDVITGCALIDPAGRERLCHDVTRVTFLPFIDEVIDQYLRDVPVLDKAGAYALQQHGDRLVARVDGSRDNVIGFPTEAISRVFKTCGLL
jgi:septum formation protein